MVLSILISIISLLFIIVLSFKINSIEESVIPVSSNTDNLILHPIKENNKVILSTLKDVCVVICSIFGANFLLSLLIQKKSQNDLYDEFITEDLLQNKKFIKSMPEDKRKILLKYIEEIDFLGENKIYSELINNVREKIVNYEYFYYFEKNNTHVVCNILSDCIEKKITKTIEVKSFDEDVTFEEFPLAQSTLEPIDGRDSIKITNLKINDKPQNVDDVVGYKKEDSDNVYHKNINYKKRVVGFYKDDMIFYRDKITKIEVVYTTYVPLHDRVYTSRLSAPCKKYDFRFRINDSTKQYRLYSQAFGFQEDATKTPAGCQPNEIAYNINDWTFPADGVFITFGE